MKTESFFDNFDLLAEAPNGVPKLRELILQLAVQGKLVPQDPNDESAFMLLGRYRDVISVLTEENGLSEVEIHPEEVPWPRPIGWVWGRLGQLVKFIGGSQPPKSKFIYEWREGYTRLVQIRDFKSDAFQTFVPNEFANRPFRADDVMIGRYGPPVFQILRGLTGTYNVALMKASPIETVLSKDFLFFLLQESRIQRTVIAESERTAGQSGVRKELLHSFIVGVPPLKEQKRIVAKVGELMNLCGKLEKRQQKRREARIHLNNSALERLLAASTPEEFNTHWQLICDNFDLLYDTAETIGKLRQSILQLAIQGRLATQCANDQPASLLLDRIKGGKRDSSTKGRSKRQSEAIPFDSDAVPFPAPSKWHWVRFCEIATIASNLVQPDLYLDLPHVAPDNIEKQTGRLLPFRTVREDEVRSSNHRFFAGQILYSKIRPNLSKATIIDFEGLCSADMYPINSHIDARFLLKYMLSGTFLSMAIKRDTRVAMPKINQDELNRILVPVPPMEEQKRIIAKVDELMKLCDVLEAKLNRAQSLSESVIASFSGEVMEANTRPFQHNGRCAKNMT